MSKKINKELAIQMNFNIEDMDNFFNLEVERQVELINEWLSKGLSPDNCKSLFGCVFGTLTKPVLAKGYKANRKTGKYEYDEEFAKKKAKEQLEVVTNHSNNTYVTLEDFNDFKDEILDLIKTNTTNNKEEVKEPNLLVDIRTNLCGETITKQYKIDKVVSERFDKFAEDNCIINKQVLVSMAIEQFLDKYTK